MAKVNKRLARTSHNNNYIDKQILMVEGLGKYLTKQNLQKKCLIKKMKV